MSAVRPEHPGPPVSAALPAPAADGWGFPRSAAGTALLVDYAGTRGIGAARALLGTGLTPASLAGLVRGGGEVTAAQELRVVRTLHRLLGEVGAEIGERYQASTFGAFGYAMLSSRTVFDAIAVALRLIDLSFAFAIPRASLAGDRVHVSVDGGALPSDVRRLLVERDTTAMVTVLEAMVPGGVGARVTWTPDAAGIDFGADQLDRPLPQRSAERLALADRMCTEVVDARRARRGLAQDVRVLITQRLPEGAPMRDVADALAVGERTLRRQLAGEDVSYQELLDEVRSSLALALLDGRATMPVAEVARRLGYAESASFIRAFRRWTGRTPTERPALHVFAGP